jgi:hypothetical protein
MYRLPVTKTAVELLPFTGAEDMLLLEPSAGELEISISLANRLASRCDGESLNAADVPLTDLEALLLELRRTVLGDTVTARAVCPKPGCGARANITFSLSEYRAHHGPRTPRFPPMKKDSNWYGISGSDVEFRLVTAGDLLAVEHSPAPKAALSLRTIRPESVSGRDITRIERWMESLCPSLSQEVQGNCPECGGVVQLFFHVRTHVQRELGFEATFLYQDVHLLASRYHWTEEKILALPRARRLQYVELASNAGGN